MEALDNNSYTEASSDRRNYLVLISFIRAQKKIREHARWGKIKFHDLNDHKKVWRKVIQRCLGKTRIHSARIHVLLRCQKRRKEKNNTTFFFEKIVKKEVALFLYIRSNPGLLTRTLPLGCIMNIRVGIHM